ncbi:glycosyltransferase family 9 protein [Sulfuricaulis sp.]
MLRMMMKIRLKRVGSASRDITRDEIEKSSKILFTVFSRYGDGIVSFKVINEFISLYPDKSFFILTSPQLSPYAKELITAKADLSYVNKRRNPIKLMKIIRKLKRENVDLGLNPLTFGTDAEFFISFAKRFSFFKGFSHHPVHYNLYDRVREYFLLPKKETTLKTFSLDNVKNVIIAPSSTDIRKSLDRNDLTGLIRQLRDRFSQPNITVALPAEDWGKIEGVGKFLLDKSIRNSEEFLKLVKSTDLFIGVDAGPLHLADALGVRAIGIFGPNAPETFLDRDSGILSVRYKNLSGVYCLLYGCDDPVCIHKLFDDFFLSNNTSVDFGRHFDLEENVCRAR